MNVDAAKNLLAYSEATWLDWKRDFPDGLLGGKTAENWDAARGEIVKDILGVANGSDGREFGYLVYGVKDLGDARKVFGISKHAWDDAMFEQWVENTVEPHPAFNYSEHEFESGKIVGVFEIRRQPDYPHVVVEGLGGVIHEGQVWYRRSTKNTIAHASELRTMFLGDPPFRFATSFDPKLKEIVEGVETDEWEPAWPLVIEKDARLLVGYEIVYFPKTRREIWLGGPGPESILMCRKRAQ